ncbi:hypothetical protein EP331_06220 [bacterium]|nr:MAG: hypothetical protein EP331_06220 [bacterium]
MKTKLSTYTISAITFCVIALVVILAGDIVWAQPPGMPQAPSQAPIDGGLGILAAASGAYAYKKLKGKKK